MLDLPEVETFNFIARIKRKGKELLHLHGFHF